MITITVPEDVARALAAAAHGQQVASLHTAGHYAALADHGKYTDEDRARLHGLASELTLVSERLLEGAVALNEALDVMPVIKVEAA